jgi:hypothetical protein
VPTFEDRGCHVVSVTDLYGRILGFLRLSKLFWRIENRNAVCGILTLIGYEDGILENNQFQRTEDQKYISRLYKTGSQR